MQIVQESTEADFAASQASVSTVRRLVEESLLQRSPEERHVIAVICATLLRTKTVNERQWISQQFAVSQFPALGDQDQMVIDIEAIIRKIRKSQE